MDMMSIALNFVKHLQDMKSEKEKEEHLVRTLYVEVRHNLDLLDRIVPVSWEDRPSTDTAYARLGSLLITDVHEAALMLYDDRKGGDSFWPPLLRNWEAQVELLGEDETPYEITSWSTAQIVGFVCTKVRVFKSFAKAKDADLAALRQTRFGVRLKNLRTCEEMLRKALEQGSELKGVTWV